MKINLIARLKIKKVGMDAILLLLAMVITTIGFGGLQLFLFKTAKTKEVKIWAGTILALFWLFFMVVFIGLIPLQ